MASYSRPSGNGRRNALAALVCSIVFAGLAFVGSMSAHADAPGQDPPDNLDGTWRILDGNGNPPVPDAQVKVDIVPTAPGRYQGSPYAVFDDGTIEYFENEFIEYFEIVTGFYTWTNDLKGTTGTLIWDRANGHFDSNSSSGNQRILVRP